MPDLILLRDSGTSDMGSLAFLEVTDVNDTGRFLVEEPDMALSGLRVHFDGTAGLADLVIRIDSHRGSAFDMTLHTIKKRGVGADVNFYVLIDQQDRFYVEVGDVVVPTWTNPGTTEWGTILALTRRDVRGPR